MEYIQHEFHTYFQYICISSFIEMGTFRDVICIQIILNKKLNKRGYFLKDITGLNKSSLRINKLLSLYQSF